MKVSKQILLASVLSLSMGMIACSAYQSAPSAKNAVEAPIVQAYDFAHEISDLKPDASVIYGKLANGLRYAVVQNDQPSKAGFLRMRIASGSLNETEEQLGAAHFLEHMAFNGSKNIPEGEMIKRLERHGLAFGADTNAYTSFDETVYMLNLPEISEELVEETFMIMRETASNLTLAQAAIDRERGIIKSEKRNRDGARNRASLANLAFMTKGSRLAGHIPIGTDASLEVLNADNLRAYYEGHYRPENAFVVFGGDMDTDIAIAKIEKWFSSWQGVGKPGPEYGAGKSPARGTDIGYSFDPELRTNITMTSLRPYVEVKDTAANRRKDFIQGMANGVFNRRLSSLAQKADAVFMGGGASAGDNFKVAQETNLSMSSSAENWKKAFAVGEQELRKALKFGFTQAEFDEQMANNKNYYTNAVKSAETRSSGGIVGGVLNSFGGDYVFTDAKTGLALFEGYEKTVSVDDLWQAFKEQWSALDEGPLFYLTSDKAVENPEAQIKAAYAASQAVEVKPNEAVILGEFAYTDFGTPGKVVGETYVKDADAYLIQFENNVLLNFKQTDFQKDRIQISISVGDGGLSAPRKDSALMSLTGRMLSGGGLKAHTSDEVYRMMTGKTVGGGLSVGGKYFNLSGSTVSADLQDEFNLLMANLIAPGFREEAKIRYDKSIKNSYARMETTPGGVAGKYVSGLLHSGDLRFVTPSLETMLSTKISDVQNWVEPQLASGQIEITVVGDVDKDAIVKQVARTFGSLDARKVGHGSYPDMTHISFPKGGQETVTLTHTGDANQALLQVYWPAPDGTDMLRNRRLSVLRNIFSNRLTKVIREEESAAYSPSARRSGSRTFKGYGYMSTSLNLVPETVPAISNKLDEIAADFKAGNFSQDEFDRAITPTLEGLGNALETNGFWMSALRNAQKDDWGLQSFRTRKQDYETMKLEDLKPLAADIFNADNAYRIQILPRK